MTIHSLCLMILISWFQNFVIIKIKIDNDAVLTALMLGKYLCLCLHLFPQRYLTLTMQFLEQLALGVMCDLRDYLHMSWKLLHILTVRSASIDINVWISPSENFDRSAMLTDKHWWKFVNVKLMIKHR